MKYFLPILLTLFFLTYRLEAQEAQQRRLQSGSDSLATAEEMGMPVKKPIKSVIKAFTLDKQNSLQVASVVDTFTINFHNFRPFQKRSISNTYLGFTGSAYQSNIFANRDSGSDFYFLRNFSAYRRQQSEVEYFNTTTPFASLMYVQGNQGSNRNEQVFRAFYTQNIDSVTNIGFRYNSLKTQSQYQLLEGTHSFLNFFASRNTNKYNGYFNIITGSNAVIENGGVKQGSIDPTLPAYYYGINLSGKMGATNKTLSIFTSHESIMGELPFLKKEKDSTMFDFTPRYGISYSAEFNRYNRKLSEPSINTAYFDTAFIKTSGAHIDSSSLFRFSQILQLRILEDEQRKFTFGKRAFLENEIVSAVHPLHYGLRTYGYSNLYAGGEIFRSNSSFWQWSAMAKFALLGRNIGDAMVKGSIVKPLVVFGDTTAIIAEAWYRDQSADVFQEHWFSNHYKWENDFKKQHDVVIKGSISYPKINAKAGVNYTMLSNYLYNNIQAMPAQYNKEFSVFSVWVSKDFNLGRFGWSNNVVWQELSDSEVLHLPVWSIYSSIYYSHFLFKVMKIQLGAEIYYHSRFFADSYEPTTNQFFIQNEVKTGGYPLLNIYANAKLKRTSAFVVLTHANNMLNFGDFFSSPAYPLDQMALKFGFFWTFYD